MRVTKENDAGDDEGSYCSSSDEEGENISRLNMLISNNIFYAEFKLLRLALIVEQASRRRR